MSMLVTSVESAAEQGGIEPRDRAVLDLALAYAKAIDDGEADLAKVGPALLAALEALRLSPRARAAAMKGGTDDKAGSPLDQLAARRAGKGRTPTVDAATS